MNQSAVFALARHLANAVLAEDWKAATILAADLDAAWNERQKFQPWSDWNRGNTK